MLELRRGIKTGLHVGLHGDLCHGGRLDEPTHACVQKLFTIHSLASKIRAVLDTTTPIAPDGEA